ncbi:cytochrome P450 [Zopfia rhizophila CBS 207.26]|uniref:Cytochrome P450 n=1 Tax=Zopfia rhizophila CBS 207.26 TaxID=1314779 RepID=A0A6A6EU98_9PEZI|nr:cytochrome P450 [Zopfia rhizophila CBS 207.26]
MLSVILSIGLGAIFIFLKKITAIDHDPREPPLIPSIIPVIGHLIGMLRHGTHYYTQISQRTKLPIYTLRLPGRKVYIVTSPKLATLCDRNAKAVSFRVYVLTFARRILVPSSKAMSALAENLYDDDGGLLPQTVQAMHDAMIGGENLEQTTFALLQSLAPKLSSPKEIGIGGRIKMFEWVKDVVTQASTDAIYGKRDNPFHDPAVSDAFCTIDVIYQGHRTRFRTLRPSSPSHFCSKRLPGREKLFYAFKEYYLKDGHLNASPLVKERFKVNSAHNISITDIAKFELGVCLGLMSNSVPTSFWCLYYLYSQPSLLSELRSEILPFAKVNENKERRISYTIDVAELLTNLPLLPAIVKETLRVLSANASGRALSQDTLLDNRYLLKKDNLLLLPAAEFHHNESVWGADYREFKPHRWLKDGSKLPASSFRIFGGGTNLCPGRNLAMNEIMVMVVMMAMRFDFTPVSVKGEWKRLKTQFHISTSVLEPVEDIKVDVKKRSGSGEDWTFLWKGKKLGYDTQAMTSS